MPPTRRKLAAEAALAPLERAAYRRLRNADSKRQFRSALEQIVGPSLIPLADALREDGVVFLRAFLESNRNPSAFRSLYVRSARRIDLPDRDHGEDEVDE